MKISTKYGWDMGGYDQTELDNKAYAWCLKNSILISPMAKDNRSWYIFVIVKGRGYRSPEAYGKNVIWQKIYEYYKHYYLKKDAGNI